jgi:hypothetical protein
MILDDRTPHGDGVGRVLLAGAQRRERASAARVRRCGAGDRHRWWRDATVSMGAGATAAVRHRSRASARGTKSNQERRIMADTQAAGPTTGHRVATDG